MPGDWLVGLAIGHGWRPAGLGCESLEAVSTMLSLVAWTQAAILILLLALAFESRTSRPRPKSNRPADSTQR